MKKRIMSLLLAMALALGLAVPAWAQSKYMVKDMPDTSLVLSPGQELEAAQKLNALGLFQGVGTNADGTPDFDLDRTPTRVEGVVMLVRLLGEDKEGQKGGWKSPFTDVPGWASSYVGYAYNFQYTKGTSETTFGSMLSLDAAQYLTLVLRAMGYTDGVDFQWDAPWDLSNALGISDYDPANPGTFTRGTAALWAWNAMSALTCRVGGSGGQQRLADQLMGMGKIGVDKWLASGLFSGAGGVALDVGQLVLYLDDGMSSRLSIMGLPEDSGSMGFTWTSSNPSVVQVSSVESSMFPNSGDLLEKSVGTAVITATSPDGTMSASCTVRVMDTTVFLEIENDSGADELARGWMLWAEDPAEFTARIMPEDSMADKNMTWELTDKDTGAVLGPDAAELKVISSDTDRGVSTVRVTVHRAGDFYLTCRTRDTQERVALKVEAASPDLVLYGPDTMLVGETGTLTVRQVKENERIPDLRVLMWKNSDPEVASVTAYAAYGSMDAKVEALKTGTTTVTAVLSNGAEVSTTITVVTDDRPDGVLHMPEFPLTLEQKDASGELLYRITITSGSYFISNFETTQIPLPGICLRLEGTVDYAAPGATHIALYVRLVNDSSGSTAVEGTLVIPVTGDTFRYVPDEVYPDLAEFEMAKGQSYTLSFQ